MGRRRLLMILFPAVLIAGGQAQTKPPAGPTQNGTSDTSKRMPQKNSKNNQQKDKDKDKGKPANDPDQLFIVAVESLKGSSETLADPPSFGAMAAPDANEIIALMGNPAPFKLKAKGSNVIVIYCTKSKCDQDKDTLKALREKIQELRSVRQRVIEVLVPHSNLLGTLVDKLKGLNYKNIAFEAVGKDKI